MSGKPRNGMVELVAEGGFPSILKYFPENIGVEDDEFLLRVSEVQNSKILQLLPRWSGTKKFPKLMYPKKLK